MALAIIVSLYVSIGALAAVGSMYLTHRFLPVKFEPVFYGLFLVAIAGFYLAFVAYFGDTKAWSFETTAVLAFAVAGCFGTRVPVVLMVGYAVHGLWDLLHEIQSHTSLNMFGDKQATQIPLAYGAFCATFDWAMVAYFTVRRSRWSTAWTARTE